MKRALLIVLIALAIFIVYLCFKEGEELIDVRGEVASLTFITENEASSLIEGKEESGSELMSFSCGEVTLPGGSDDGAFYYSGALEAISFYSVKGVSVAAVRESEKEISFFAYKGGRYKRYKLISTGISIVSIELPATASKNEPILEDYIAGSVTVFDAESGEVRLDIVSAEAEFKIRGLSSLAYDKKSYTLKFVDETYGRAAFAEPLGLPSNTRFALNSLYEDESKIRDALALGIWERIGEEDNGIGFAYVELFINNEYRGLYGFHEIIDENTLGLKPEESAVVYKMSSFIIPQKGTYSKAGNIWGSAEAVYSANIDNKWLPLSELFESIYYSGEPLSADELLNSFDIDNCADYFILLEIACANDNIWKNVVLSARERGGKTEFLITAWDFDLTFGLRWNEASELKATVVESAMSEIMNEKYGRNFLMNKLWESERFRRAVCEKWFELRRSVLSEENLLAFAGTLCGELRESGALKREASRWPKGAASDGNGFIERFISARLEVLDEYFSESYISQ